MILRFMEQKGLMEYLLLTLLVLRNYQPKLILRCMEVLIKNQINCLLMGADAYRTHISQLEAYSWTYLSSQIASLPYMNDNPLTSGYYKYHNQTNWQDQVFKSSMSQNYFLKVRGGDDIAKFGLSVGYLNNKGIVEGTESNRYSTRLNAALRLTEKLTVDANMSFINNIQNQWDQGFAYKTAQFI